MDATARNAYGFNTWTQAIPGGLAIMAETQVGQGGLDASASGALDPLPLHWNNPLFWLLALFLIFTGWLFLGADLGIKKIGKISVKSG